MSIQPGTELRERRYRVVKAIGRGGFGEVYLAWDGSLKRQVALKRNAEITPESHVQFEREATLLAGLHHPNLPRVTDYFTAGTGEQFLVMDFVAGQDLATLVRQNGQLSVKDALGYVYQVCNALQYLHAQSPPVIHRDIKPENIIITPQGQAMLVDFGIFKRYDAQRATVSGARGISPGYSPPEQYGRGQTDARSDIYSLGATLYHLLAGRPPEDGPDLSSGSAKLTPLKKLNPSVSEGLARAISGALAPRQGDRPPTVAAFREQLELAQFFSSIRAPLPIAPVQNPAASGQPSRVQPRPVKPNSQRASMTTSGPAVRPSTAPRPKSPSGKLDWDDLLYLLIAAALVIWVGWLILRPDPPTPVLPARAVLTADNAASAALMSRWGRGIVNEIAYSPDGDRVAVAASLSVSLYDGESLERDADHWTDVAATSVAFAPDGERLASGQLDGRILLWPLPDGEAIELGRHAAFVSGLAFTPDGALLLSASGDGQARLWPAAGGESILLADGDSAFYAVAASPDGLWLAAAGADGAILLWDARTAAPWPALAGHADAVQSLAFAPNGATLASAGDDGVVNLWRVTDGALVGSLPGQGVAVKSVAFSPDGTKLAVGYADKSLRLWSPGDNSALWVAPAAHAGSINTVAFSPDGRTLASSSGDDTVRLWRAADGLKLAESVDYFGWVHGVSFPPGGSHVAVALGDQSARRLRLTEADAPPNLVGHTAAVRCLDYAPNGLAVATGGADNTVRLWRSATGELLYTMTGHTDIVNSVAFAPDGATVASGSSDGSVRLWRVADGVSQATLAGQASPIWSVAFNPDGTRLAAGLENGSILVWSLPDGNLARILRYEQTAAVRGVAFSPDGATLVSVWDGGSADLWTMPDGPRRQLLAPGMRMTSVAYSPDGRVLAVGIDDRAGGGHVGLLSVANGTLLKNLALHRGAVTSVAFSNDGTTLASGAMDGVLRVWGVVTESQP